MYMKILFRVRISSMLTHIAAVFDEKLKDS